MTLTGVSPVHGASGGFFKHVKPKRLIKVANNACHPELGAYCSAAAAVPAGAGELAPTA